MNESLRRALLRSRLSEEDVAARLEVDPKTVRRWLEGRVPYLRHRWALVGLLGAGEEELWPRLRTAGSLPDEVLAIYPHLNAVPRETWLRLFSTAEREIDILAGCRDGVIDDDSVQAELVRQARAGISVRLCLMGDVDRDSITVRRAEELMTATSGLSALPGVLGASGLPQIRVRRGVLYAAMYHVDGEMLVSHRAHGIPDVQAPVLHLRADAGGAMAAHLQAFERVWASGRSSA